MKVTSNRPALLLISLIFLSCFFVNVNANDSDGDGILDVDDDCQYSNGNSSIDRDGCPDRDGDGTSDYNDFWTSPQGDFDEVEEINWDSEDGDIESVDYSPDGKYVVVGDDSGTLSIFSAAPDILASSTLLSLSPLTFIFAFIFSIQGPACRAKIRLI